MAPTLPQRLYGYALPGVLMIAGAAFFLAAAITAPKLLFTDFRAYRERAFALLWAVIGPVFSQDVPKSFEPLLDSSRGVILDVGPGAGHQLFRFSHPENITVVYGAEPGVGMHDSLRSNAAKAGLGDKYKILTCGAEQESLMPSLAKAGLLGKKNSLGDGIFDEIVCCRVLCGVPSPKETVEGLYRCLKPGGRFVILEHVKNDERDGGSQLAMFLQHFYMALGWNFCMGTCHLTRETVATVTDAAKVDGGWAEAKVQTEDKWSLLPHAAGYFIKRT